MNQRRFITGVVALACRAPIAAPCRAAICLSGHIRSFVYPVVHRSIRRNLIEAIEANGCQVDVFAYATLEDSGCHPKEGVATDFTPDTADAMESLDSLEPTRLVWHHEQAGIIPSSCPADTYGNATERSANNTDVHGSNSWGQWFQLHREGYSHRFYWQLYKSLAAYRMALREEISGGFVYDWIVRARFDLAWLRPLPPLRSFSSEFMWFAEKIWPMSDEFALVPRAFSDQFFSAIKTFYACDGVSWPPTTSWWQPACFGREFEASVLFRHLHASEIPYRVYSMFDYVLARGGRGTRCDFTKEVYETACALLGHGGLLPSNFHSGDCAMTFAEWAGLRCQTLLPAEGMRDARRSAAIVDPDLRAWEVLVGRVTLKSGDGTEEVSSAPDLERLRLSFSSLRDAVELPPPTLDANISDRTVWRVNSPFNCDIDTYTGRAPQIVTYYTGGASLLREVALAIKCLAHRLAEGSYSSGGGDFEYTVCAHTRALEVVMIDVSLHWNELGVCTSDGGLKLSADEQIDSFFVDPVAHCVGYGRLEADPAARILAQEDR